MFTFTPYYEPSPPSREVVANSMSSLWQFSNEQKVCIYIAVHTLMPAQPVLGGTPSLPLVHLLLGSIHSVEGDTVPVPGY